MADEQPAKLPKREPDTKCNGRNKTHTKYCQNPAGKGTDHVGLGRCKLHGGKSRVTTGIASRIRHESLAALIEEFAADPDPLNISGELHLLRALTVDYVNRYQDFALALLAWHESYLADAETAKPRQLLDLASARELVSEITRTVERIERIRQNRDALPRSEVLRIVSEFAKAVDLHVNDDTIRAGAEKVKERIRNAWDSIRL